MLDPKYGTIRITKRVGSQVCDLLRDHCERKPGLASSSSAPNAVCVVLCVVGHVVVDHQIHILDVEAATRHI